MINLTKIKTLNGTVIMVHLIEYINPGLRITAVLLYYEDSMVPLLVFVRGMFA